MLLLPIRQIVDSLFFSGAYFELSTNYLSSIIVDSDAYFSIDLVALSFFLNPPTRSAH